jgi:hypothetical protein
VSACGYRHGDGKEGARNDGDGGLDRSVHFHVVLGDELAAAMK